MFYIKGYGIAVAFLSLLFQRKAKYMVWLFGWLLVLLAVPLVLLPYSYLASCYKEWFHLFATIHLDGQSSVQSLLLQYFSVDIPDEIFVLCCFLIFLLPLTNFSLYKKTRFGELMTALLLLFLVLFNKMAEVPTYILAMAGVCIWVNSEKKLNWFDYTIVVAAVVVTTLLLPVLSKAVIDRVPISSNIIVMPYLMAWIKIQYLLWKMEFRNLVFTKLHHLKS